jgi:hypothetical protein
MLEIIKRKLLLLLGIILATMAIKAQKRASLGLKIGGGVSSYYFVTDININPDFIDNDYMQVYEGGLVFNYLDKNMGLQIGAQYSQKGWVENFQNGASAKVMLDCIEFPLLTQFRSNRYKKSGWLLLLGTYGNYVIQTSKTFNGEPDYTMDSLFIKYNELEYNTFEFGLKGGAGFEFGLGENSLQLQVLFTQGFVNFFDSDRTGVYRSLSQNLSVSAIYKFTLFRREELEKK